MGHRLVHELGDKDNGGEDAGHEAHWADDDVEVSQFNHDLGDRWVKPVPSYSEAAFLPSC